MAAAAADPACVNLLRFPSGCVTPQPMSGLRYFVGVPLNSEKNPGRRRAYGVRRVGVNFFMSGGVRMSELSRSTFAIQCESSKRCNSRRLWSDGLGHFERRRNCLTPRAAVATGAGGWESRRRWEDGVQNRTDFWRAWDLKPTSSGERLAFFGILALTGLAAIRVLRGSSLLSVGAIVLFLCLGGFHQRLKPIIFFVSEKLQYLQGSLIRTARLKPISFKEQGLRTTTGNGLYNLSDSWPTSQISGKANGTVKAGPSIDVKDAAECVNHLTSIIGNLGSEMAAGDVQSVNDLMKLQLGISELREDLYRAASVLHARESLLQSKLQRAALLDTLPVEEHTRGDGMAVQVPLEKVKVNFEIGSVNSQCEDHLSFLDWSESKGFDLGSQEEGRNVVSMNPSDSSDFLRDPLERSNEGAALKEGVQGAGTYQVITTVYELETVSEFTPVAPKSHASASCIESEVAREGDGDIGIFRAGTGNLQDIKRSREQINSMKLVADGVDESAIDIAGLKTAVLPTEQETIREDKVLPSLEVEALMPSNRIEAEEPTPMYNSNEGGQPMNTIVMEKASPDPWRDDYSPGSEFVTIDENERFPWETVVMQHTLAAASSGRWREDDSDGALHLSSTGRGNPKPSVDIWGNNTPNAGRVQRGTLTKRKTTRRGSVGSVDNVDNELPRRRGGVWKDEQLSQGQVRRKDPAERAGQPIMSGKQYVPEEREEWDYNSVMDEPASSKRSFGGARIYEEDERDIDTRNVSAGEYSGRGSHPRKNLEEEGEDQSISSPDGRYSSQETSRSKVPNSKRSGRQIIYEEEEETLDGRDARDLEQYSGSERRGLLSNEVGAPQNGRDLNGNYDSFNRTSSSSRVPVNSRSTRQIVEEEEENEDEESRYRKETRSTEEEETQYGTGSKSSAGPQSSGREVQRGSTYGLESEIRNSDLPPYGQSEVEPAQRNLPVRQPSRMQLEKFDRLLDEGEALLEEGIQGLEGRIEVGVAERMLYEAANLFEEAAEINPSSLIAMGYWGNTLLVHGELKLKLSQQLRSMIPSSNSSYSTTRARAGRDDQRESLEFTLQNVCEECEELLVDAGRKYRTALTLDRADMRALYNWGLALCYRGQLIADEGGERAIQDADKVYLAAIDKFEAMLGLSQEYAGGALYNWGLAMRDRSRLRPMGDRERVKLLLQAKELFQDAVRLDPNKGQARGAVAAVVAEFQELRRFEEMQNEEESDERPSRNWWR
ncbi:hypothetical protein Mapa_017797 [Marchantia paleacea]|nr:hypothetical protein Mapa_017797 [Marchantia paleacea]